MGGPIEYLFTSHQQHRVKTSMIPVIPFHRAGGDRMHGLSDTTVDLPPTGLPTAATDSTGNPKPASVSMSRSKTKTYSPWRHPIRQRSHKITNAKQGAYVTPLLHRSWDITLAVVLTAIKYSDNVGMPQRRSEVCLAKKALPECRIRRYVSIQQLQCIAAWQTGMLGEVHLAHSSGS
ncbi:hypothetical protein K6L26_01635 [Mycolicibacterium farcinogenes]|uniref:Uncharacterized protein n=1 Tax=Mycolicibacterium farcinogenes TaxID=1802 RepID=A0ACD1FHQ0_MYCFR|nr:hypothetical protein K6L26_01635 [Mycolicibacterium farcinogenes]